MWWNTIISVRNVFAMGEESDRFAVKQGIENMNKQCFAIGLALGALTFNAAAWDYDGHHMVNELAIASLPKDFGIELTPALKGRIAFLAGEPDRWRNVPDLTLKHFNGPDHYLDLEDIRLIGLTPETLPVMRYDFVTAIANARTAHPEKFLAIDPAKDADHTRELYGFLPWAITEYYQKLKSDFSSLKTFQQFGGTPEEIANAKADCIYIMGVMGHFVGDGAQPLHTSKHYDGWVGENPQGYTTGPVKGERARIHSWIDGGYVKKTGGLKFDALAVKIHPAEKIANAADADGMFRDVVAYIQEQNKYVAPLYQMEKDGQLTGEEGKGMEARPFVEGQIVKAGQMLGNIWWTAWQEAPEDKYLQTQLQQRAEKATEQK